MRRLQQEAERHGDILFVDAPETPNLIRKPTRFSGFTKQGRGMPTFKQFAFFRYSAQTLTRVRFVAKVDDDSALNLQRLYMFLERVRCYPHVLFGGINWSGFVPKAHWSGIRGDRCGWGWNLWGALWDYDRQLQRGQTGYHPVCHRANALLPFPFAMGAGYVLSGQAMRWVGSSPDEARWVEEAAGAGREELRWQKFEDTTMGYWLLYAPFNVTYVDVNRWMHNGICDPNGANSRTGGAFKRPPSTNSVTVHDLKRGGFRFAWEQMRGPDPVPYNHTRCLELDWRERIGAD